MNDSLKKAAELADDAGRDLSYVKAEKVPLDQEMVFTKVALAQVHAILGLTELLEDLRAMFQERWRRG